VLYDADRIEEVAGLPNEELIDGHRSLILDPNDPTVIAEALKSGVHESTIKSAQESPVYKFVKTWKLALPPHIEFRTMPMLFYVPALSPVTSTFDGKITDSTSEDLFHDISKSRVPMQFLGNLLGAGYTGKVEYALRKLKAVRWYRRAVTVGDVDMETAERILREADCSVEEAEEIYKLTSLCTVEDRFVIPPAHREEAIEALHNPMTHKQEAGFGFLSGPRRGM
jgi:nitrate reductase beta subunit